MKIGFVLLAFIVATVSSWYVFAAQDYERLKKDVSVMTQIIDSVFKADNECKRCNIKVVGKYLAGQGIVFMINSRSHGFSFSSSGDSSDDFSFSFEFLEDLEELHNLPGMVEEIVTSVLPSYADAPDVLDVDRRRIIGITSTSTREALRELRRQRRDLQQEIRESEIEMIHMEEGKTKALEANIREMEEVVIKLEKQRRQIEEKEKGRREASRRTREEARQKKLQFEKEQREIVQNKVLRAFCDYGSALRSLPAREKITIIFEKTHTRPQQDTILVFDQNRITNCNRDDGSLRNQALTYLF